MSLTLSRWFLLVLVLLSAFTRSAATPSPVVARALAIGSSSASDDQYDCRPFGECEPCPRAQRNEPFCQPYGNRRLLHCVPKGTAHHDISDADGQMSNLHEKEIPAWEACGKVVLKERQDYWEFVTTNLLFCLVGLTVLLLRGRKLAMLQYRQLAARIGLPGGGGSSDQRGRFLSFSL